MTSEISKQLVFSFLIVFLLVIFPVSAVDQSTELNAASSIGTIYVGDVIPNTVTSVALCPSGCEDAANAPAWNGFRYYDGGGVSGWISETGYITSNWTVPGSWGYTRFAPCVVCIGCPGYSTAVYHPLNGGYYTYSDTTRPAPSITVSGSPSSGTPVYISNISINGLTSFDTVTYFNITAPNSSVYNLVSPSQSFNIDAEGEWIIRATATNSGGSDFTSESVWGNAVDAPVADFSCSPLNTTSPALVTCTDSSTHMPTSWNWQFTSFGVDMSPDGSYGAGIFTAVNTTQNPTIYMEGSGIVDVRLTAQNAVGSDQELKEDYVTISGIAPTPTPTPSIPWPNQTGVCRGSSISLGSQEYRDYLVHYQLTSPQYDTFSGQYNIGQQNLITGYAFFTALTGTYVYNEYNLTSELLWRQSYVVEECSVTTVPTTIPITNPTTVIPYTIVPITYPTVPPTLDLSSDWNDTISIVPATIATIPMMNQSDVVNVSDLRSIIAQSNSLLIPYLNFIDSIMTQPMYWFFTFLGVVTTIQSIMSPALYAINLFTSILGSMEQYLILTTVCINLVISNIPEEWINFFTFCLVIELLLYIWHLKSGRSV